MTTSLYARASAAKAPPVGDERILFRLNRGDLVVGLFDGIAPKHAAQIRRLVRAGVYDTTTIFRVEPGFVAQVINAQNRLTPLTPEQRQTIQRIPAELSKLQHRAGMLSMAHDDKSIDSAETSFSFMLGRAPELDGKYTIFGQVEWGATLLTMIAREPRDDQNRPYNRIVIDRAEVKTGAAIAELRTTKQLRAPIPLAAMPKAGPVR
ncbi:MAG TPA: peptidylprolyl isomerase [Polyangia bacterium]